MRCGLSDHFVSGAGEGHGEIREYGLDQGEHGGLGRRGGVRLLALRDLVFLGMASFA